MYTPKLNFKEKTQAIGRRYAYAPHYVPRANLIYDSSDHIDNTDNAPLYFMRSFAHGFSCFHSYLKARAEYLDVNEDVVKILMALELFGKETAKFYFSTAPTRNIVLSLRDYAYLEPEMHDEVLEQLLHDLTFGHHKVMRTPQELTEDITYHSVAYCTCVIADICELYAHYQIPLVNMISEMTNEFVHDNHRTTPIQHTVFVRKLEQAINDGLKEAIDLLYDGVPIDDIIAA